MDLRRLEAFSKVFELRSFSKAGEALFLSQPTISAHVASLESDLGVKLFDRLGRSILPTAAGDILYRHAQKVFSSLETAKAEIQLLQDEVSGALAIGASTIPAHYLLPPMLASFVKRYPAVTMHLRVGDSESIVQQVQNGTLVTGVVGAQYEDYNDLEFIPILEDDLVIVAAPDTLPGKSALELSDLEALSWVMREKGSGTRLAIEKGLLKSGVDPRSLNTALIVESTQAVLRCVKAGLGVSITSRLAAYDEINRGELIVLPCSELQLGRHFYCVFQKQRFMFPAVSYFIDFLQERAKELNGSRV